MSEQHFPTPRPVQLEVKLAAGDVRVVTGDGEQSTVTLEGPQKLLDVTTVELRGDRLVIEQRRKSLLGLFTSSGDSLRVEVRVPHRSTVEIATASVEATLEGTFGGLAMKAASGNVVVTGEIEGDVEIKTTSGDARLARVAGDLSVQTVSGNVTAQSVEGSVTVKSVSGHVRIGSVREGRVNVQNVSGDVELGIAAGTNIDVDAGSASGELNSELPLSDAPADDAAPTVVIRSNSVSGDFHLFRAA